MAENNMKTLLKYYLENKLSTLDGQSEFEIRFGTKGIKKISKIDYDNVIKKLLSIGFVITTNNEYTLKMASEFINKEGEKKISNIRVEVSGLHNIQKYCETNLLDNLPIVLNQKFNVKDKDNILYPVNVDDFNLRISYQKEKEINTHSAFAEKIKSTWKDSKKIFRYTNRVSLIHDKYPVRVDLTIVKESQKQGKFLKPEYTFQTADIINKEEKYEIEMELLNEKIGIGTEFNDVSTLEKMVKKNIKFILSGLQETNYPISTDEMNDVLENYLKLIKNDVLNLFFCL